MPLVTKFVKMRARSHQKSSPDFQSPPTAIIVGGSTAKAPCFPAFLAFSPVNHYIDGGELAPRAIFDCRSSAGKPAKTRCSGPRAQRAGPEEQKAGDDPQPSF